MKVIKLPAADVYNHPYSGSSSYRYFYKELNAQKESKKRLVSKLLKKQDFKCAYCGIDLRQRGANLEHVTPVKRGGTNDISNLVIS